MASDKNGTPEKVFSWLKVWTTPFGLFVIFVVITTFLLIYNVAHDRQETFARRQAFCESENAEARKVRLLWDGVIIQSQANPLVGFVTVDGKRYEVTRPPPNQEVLKRFRNLINDTYPLRDCDDPQFTPAPLTPAPMSPTPSP